MIIYYIEKSNNYLIKIIKTDDEKNINNIVNNFLIQKYNTNEIIYSEKTKNEILNDKNCKDGIYFLNNFNIYEKKINISSGYFWVEQVINFNKLGKIVIKKKEMTDDLFNINIDEVKSELSPHIQTLLKILINKNISTKEKLEIFNVI